MRTVAEPRDAERFSGNGSLTTFTLSRFVQKAVDLEVFVENVQQEPIVAYDVNGTSLIFTEAVPSGSFNVYVLYRKFDSGAQVYVPDGSVSYNKLANNIRLFTVDNYIGNTAISTYALSEAPADANTLAVSIDGIVQRAPINYTTTANTITFTSAPPSGSNVHIKHLGFRSSSVVTAIPAGTTITQPILSNPTITLAAQDSSFKGNVALYSSDGANKVGQFGATSSGQVQLDVGANTLSVRSSTIALANVTAFSIANTSGATSVSVDAAGRMLRPGQPAFCAQASGNYQTTTPVPFTSAKVNTGGHFNTSTYRFTAPVAGRYIFTLHMYFDNNNSGDGYPRFKVNGATNHGYIYMQGNSDGDKTSSMTTMIQMATNDYIEVIYNGNLNYYGGPEETQFTGYLIG
jgi:hypothetical protein